MGGAVDLLINFSLFQVRATFYQGQTIFKY